MQSPQARVSGPNLSQYELSTYCQVAEILDFYMFFLSSPDISVACFAFISKRFICPAIVNRSVLIKF